MNISRLLSTLPAWRPVLLRRTSSHRPRSPLVSDHALLAATLAMGAMAALAAVPARATLGEDVKTVEVDRQQVRAAAQVRTLSKFTVHDLQSPGGAIVHEYISPAGVVFGVSWGGRSLPNLRQLLGAHFDTFTSSPNRQEGGRGHLVVREGKLFVESSGHMRSFHGRAYLTDALPTGVSVDDIK